VPDVPPVHTRHGVDRADRARRRNDFVEQLHDRFFVGQGEVVAVDSRFMLPPDRFRQVVRRDFEALVPKLDSDRARGRLVHLRRSRVGDGPSENP
jgi:hypothetical protein